MKIFKGHNNWASSILGFVLLSGCAIQSPPHPICTHKAQFQVAEVTLFSEPTSNALVFQSGLMINADGAPDAYHPLDTGSDRLSHAGKPGNWWGLATDTGNGSGTPYIQSKEDPNPGYYISQTALFDTSKKRNDPSRYVNANTIPYIVIPGGQHWGVQLGDLVMVINNANGKNSPAIVAEIGPKDKIGEGSIALAELLGVDSNPRTGGIESDITYILFPGTGRGFPTSPEETLARAQDAFVAWGGIQHLTRCFK